MAMLNIPGATTPGDPTTISTQAQDVAKAQGVAFEEVGKAPEAQWDQLDQSGMRQGVLANAPVASGMNFVDQDKSTVSGQLNTLLATDSPYLREARYSGQKVAADRGMLNSSIAAGTAQREAYKAALPIAQQDAQTYAQAQNLQQQATNAQTGVMTEGIVSSKLAEQNAGIKQTQQNIQNAFQSKLANANEQSKVWLQDLQNSYTASQAALDKEHNLLLQAYQGDQAKMESLRAQTSAIMQNYQISVENLMTDPDFLNLGPEALQNAITQLQTLAANSLSFIGGVAEESEFVQPFVDAYLAPLDFIEEESVDDTTTPPGDTTTPPTTTVPPAPPGGGPVNPDKWRR
jgi:hypothetical protein